MRSWPNRAWREAPDRSKLLTLGAVALLCGLAILANPEGPKILKMFQEASPGTRPWHTNVTFTVGEGLPSATIHDLATQAEVWQSRPSWLEFAPNNVCNLRCVMCGQSDGVPVGLSSRYWWVSAKELVPAG